ncbi:lytic murein transglycosylase [Serratia marcescens]|uniref:lytic transglycosylase domain-containing protein n=1 Tax=Serratia marcescens TaxID=615 RepID=UPI0007455053|nr:lytic transglycosylase domain-containing protein [Serratia marcescens]CUZ83523.1 lytic murein transglycosylase [Serratia marcescens]CVA51937.1 lytic murein transglycosylase [Serratia marcescens]CVA78186.1 lytic murein transglycosylase [Serratia marcescens]CVH13253.1 lytic murein transglycosylase [Serratia marcescens]
MAGPWEKYQNAAPAESPSDGPWTKYQQPQQSPPQQGGDVVSAAEQRFGIPAGLLGAVISKESSGNANAMSGKGAIGLTQVMPNTARGMGYDPEELKRNPAMQVEAGARYLKQMIDAHDGNVSAALAAYNWGPGNVQKYLRGEKTQVPTETVNYVNDPRFAQWTQQAAPGSDDELAQLAQQSSQPWAQQAPAPTTSQNIEQAARGLANIPFDILQGGANLVNAGSRAVGGGDVLDPVYRPVNRPTDPYAQAGEAIGNYLTPGVGPVAGAMIGSIANAGNEQGDFASNASKEMLLNAALLGAPAALRGIRAMSGARTGATQAAAATPAAIETANDVSNLARTAAGRDVLAGQAAKVTDDIARAAETAGVDINALTPGMRSGSRGVAQAEGALASTPGVSQDAHQAAFNEIASKFNQNLDDLGAAAGTASEKSSSIKQRIMGNLDEMKNAERAAWDDVRATMPNQKMPLSNANAVIQGERSAGVPLSPEMKQLLGANRGGVTFDGMKAWRAKFADAEQKYIRSGEANAARRAGEVRRAITDDMRNMAEQGGFIDDWTRANDLSKARLTAQENAESIFGRGLANDVLVTNGVKALQSSSAKGLNGPSGFHSIISALPEAERVPAISSILQDAISHGVRGGKSDAAGINHIATLLTPQNVNAINRYSKDLGRIADAYGTLARAAVKPQQYVERTGRTTEVLKALDSGLPKIAQTVLDATGNSTAGAVVGATGGGVIGATVGATAGAVIKSAVAKISKTRSGRYAIEKAIQEATKAVKSGSTPQAVAEAERRFLANKVAVKAIRDAVGSEEFERLVRSGIVASLSGMNAGE